MENSAVDKDYFSKQAEFYAKFRPNYPKALYDYLLSQTAEKKLLWDCATGTGQVASELSGYFNEVIATDLSQAQLDQAIKKDNIIYQQSAAEKTQLLDHSVDLVTVAQAAHWFDMALFEKELMRVLKPQGVVAIWMYNLPSLDERIDQLRDYLYQPVLGEYWPEGREHIDSNYQDINLPSLKALDSPAFEIKANWQLEDLMGYFRSWSSTQRYINKNGKSPLDDVSGEFTKLWGGDSHREVTWEIVLKVYKIY
ncbi:class I SAM-dependent methyltransferase [Fangia hongkongensis]|uniref:class I SAM-dependent methyltransferase n=1 Tax=Fangia hongkongensis TaxID=270495 RepID=UPI0003823CF6|nr:class I SAM-dependent methyltransferase [Fangia hongkongensis]MBK2124902.1 class I SAM-dependent methyltransferase [Fangia hongkongensis]